MPAPSCRHVTALHGAASPPPACPTALFQQTAVPALLRQVLDRVPFTRAMLEKLVWIRWVRPYLGPELPPHVATRLHSAEPSLCPPPPLPCSMCSALMLVGAKHKVTVGEVEKRHKAEVGRLLPALGQRLYSVVVVLVVVMVVALAFHTSSDNGGGGTGACHGCRCCCCCCCCCLLCQC